MPEQIGEPVNPDPEPVEVSPRIEDDLPEPLKVRLRAAAKTPLDNPTEEEKQQVEYAYVELYQFRKLWNKQQAIQQLDLGE